MATVTVTSRGQVTFRRDVLEHLGIKPGGRIKLELLPNGRAEPQAEDSGSWRDLQGVLRGRTNGVQLSMEELNEAIAEAGAIAGMTSIQRKGRMSRHQRAPATGHGRRSGTPTSYA